jgi:3-hydroxyisobutyrate dehydrogenase-like beta-hydroxyacid dehydrogenase
MEKAVRVGFIGLGFMGQGMAVNILAKGFPLTVMAHRKREAVDDLVARGATEVTTPAALAARSDVVILCVTGVPEVDSLVRGEQGIACGAKPGLIVVDCSTSDPTNLLALAEEFAPQGIRFVDAPLSRTPEEAWKGQLAVMVGADAQMLARIRPVLEAFASTILCAGAPGNGHKLKLINNFIALGYAALYAEALVLLHKAGLTTQAFDELISASRMDCALFHTFMGWALEGNKDAHKFSLQNCLKDTTYVTQFSTSLGLPAPLAAALQCVYAQAVDAGFGSANLPELPRPLAAAAGVKLVQARPG